jgi:AAA family ATP:ADP antiporter
MRAAPLSPDAPMPTPLDRVSRVVSDVRSGEALTAILFATTLFVGLFAYYVLKTVREPLILATGGAEVKAYATGIQAVVLMLVVPVYGALARRLERRTLVLGAQALFLVSVELFAVLSALRVPYLGIVFYVWLGVYVLTSVAQLWSLANDVYPQGQGLRLFPLVALGAPLGSAAGALFASRLFDLTGASSGGTISALIHVSAGLLLLQLLLLVAVFRRPETAAPAPVLDGAGGFQLVWKSSYLRWVAALVVVLNLVNTTGEFLLSRAVLDEAAQALAAARAAGEVIADERAFRETFLRGAYGDFYFVVNATSVLVQAFLASRLVRHLGMKGVLLALPVVALGTYGLAAVGPALRALPRAQDRRERDGLLHPEHGQGLALAADEPRREVQGQAGRRRILHALRRRALRRARLPRRERALARRPRARDREHALLPGRDGHRVARRPRP